MFLVKLHQIELQQGSDQAHTDGAEDDNIVDQFGGIYFLGQLREPFIQIVIPPKNEAIVDIRSSVNKPTLGQQSKVQLTTTTVPLSLNKFLKIGLNNTVSDFYCIKFCPLAFWAY